MRAEYVKTYNTTIVTLYGEDSCNHISDECFSYDVTGLIGLEEYCKDRIVGYKFIRRIIEKLVIESEELLGKGCPISDLITDPKFIYIEPDTGEVFYLIYPANRQEQSISLRLLAEFLLEKTDHNDRQAVHFVYPLYTMINNGDYAFSRLLLH